MSLNTSAQIKKEIFKFKFEAPLPNAILDIPYNNSSPRNSNNGPQFGPNKQIQYNKNGTMIYVRDKEQIYKARN